MLRYSNKPVLNYGGQQGSQLRIRVPTTGMRMTTAILVFTNKLRENAMVHLTMPTSHRRRRKIRAHRSDLAIQTITRAPRYDPNVPENSWLRGGGKGGEGYPGYVPGYRGKR